MVKVFHLRLGMIPSFLTFIIMAVIVIGGIVGRYLKTTILSKYWRTLHIPLTAVFYVLLAVHLLAKTDMLVIQFELLGDSTAEDFSWVLSLRRRDIGDRAGFELIAV